MSTSRRNGPTIKDIARACGLSEASVSYAMNGKVGVGAATREKVERVMREFNYHPNAVARSLTTRTVRTIGVTFGQVSPGHVLQDPYMVGILGGVMIRCETDGFHVTLFTDHWERPEQSVGPMKDGRCDGVLALAPPSDSGIVEALVAADTLVVSIAGAAGLGAPMVDVDNSLGTTLAARHLVQLGHRRIGYFNGTSTAACRQPRLEAFLSVMRECGVEQEADLTHDCYFMAPPAYQKTLEMLQSPQRPSAILAANDTSAFGVLQAARQLGIRVPEELSVVGFDDCPAAALIHPGLTTVRQPLEEIGAMAASLLIERIMQRDNPQVDKVPSLAPILLRPELTLRGTTARVNRQIFRETAAAGTGDPSC